MSSSQHKSPRKDSSSSNPRSGTPGSTYKVYIIDYTGVPGSDDHRAIFVATSGTLDSPKGPVLHVIGPKIDPKTKRANMYFERKERTPFQSTTFKTSTFVGEVSSEKLEKLEEVAKGVPAPSRRMNQRRPNCVTWVDNVLFKLNKDQVLAFDPGFQVPTKEVSLVG